MYRENSEPVYLVLHGFKMFVPVRVNGVETLAHLDTAANMATVSERIARSLPRTGKRGVRSAFEEREFETVSVEMEFMGNVWADVVARVYTSEDPIPFVWDAALSAHEIFYSPIVFDFHILALLPAGDLEGGTWKEIPSEFTDEGICLVEMGTEKRTINAIFDTGASLTVVNGRYMDSIGLHLEPSFETEVRDATGTVQKMPVNICRGLYLGNMELPAFDCLEIDLNAVEEALGHRIDLVFGANAMLKSGLRWLFNREKNRVSVME